MLDNLPPELHEHIVRLACEDLDDHCYPPASLALSRVSHYWSTLARQYKFYAIRLSKLNALPNLLTQLEILPPLERRVRILRLSDDESNGKSWPGLDNNDSSGYPISTHLAYQAYLVRFLAILAPTLRMLSIRLTRLIPATAILAYVWSLRFPNLESLEMCGYYPFPKPKLSRAPTEVERDSATTTNFPCLRSLVLDGVGNPYGLFNAGILDATLPLLKDLEIRGMRCAPYFALQIRDALSSRIADCSWPNQSQSAVPSTLETLVLEVANKEDDCGTRKVSRREQFMRDQMMTELVGLVKFADTTRWVEGRRVDVKVAHLSGA